MWGAVQGRAPGDGRPSLSAWPDVTAGRLTGRGVGMRRVLCCVRRGVQAAMAEAEENGVSCEAVMFGHSCRYGAKAQRRHITATAPA